MATHNPLVSIVIVDYKADNPYLLESLEKISNQSYKNYEIILVTDFKTNVKFNNLITKSYNKVVGPATKRDDGAKIAKGEIVSFLDDDAYPDKDWLKNLITEFEDNSVCAVGGPGVTPNDVSWREEASGWASASPVGSAGFVYRFLPQSKRFVDDFPSMNLSVRKKDFLKIGGFDSRYWPGEDTKLCLDLVHKLNKKIIYSPKVLVYHHRRPVLVPHLRQNGNFGLHRGFFARVLPETSLRPIYFAPPMLLAFVVFSPILIRLSQSFASLSLLNQITYFIYFIYFLLLFLNSVWIFSKSKKIIQAFLSMPIIFITHLWYGARFLQGFLFTDKLSK